MISFGDHLWIKTTVVLFFSLLTVMNFKNLQNAALVKNQET